MLEIKNLSIGFLKKDLFSNVSLRFFAKEKYGLVGANGCGKSTLLKILAKEIEADDGEVEIDPLCRLFRLGQDFSINDEESILDVAMSGKKEAFLALKKKEEILAGDAQKAFELAALEEKIASLDGYRLKALAQEILEGLGIATILHNNPIKVLSGGYKWRVFLAQVLINQPDILLLDEPTNHLDIISIHWLENFLSNYAGIIILVSHDKRFMDNVATCILDIDFRTITQYKGNFSHFEKARAEFLLRKEKEILSQQKEIEKKQDFVERFRAKASKARQAQSRLKQIEKIVIQEPIRTTRISPKFNFLIDTPGSKLILEVKNLHKSYGDKKVISDVSFFVQQKEKIAIIGANGTGKSTLIKALALEFSECNKSVKWGAGVSLGYFAQDCGSIIKHTDKSVLEWLWQFCGDKPQSFVQGYLGKMLFSKDDVSKSTKSLSGGELSRLYFAYLMMLKPNVLLLDEPTNHLDLESIDALTQSLKDYEGTVIFVSHDRFFISNLAKRIIEVKPQNMQDYLGSYDDFIIYNQKDYLDAKSQINSNKEKNLNKSNANTYEEQKQKKSLIQKLNKDLQTTIDKINLYEEEINTIDKRFSNETDYSKFKDLHDQKEQIKLNIDTCLKKWEEIEASLKELEN